MPHYPCSAIYQIYPVQSDAGTLCRARGTRRSEQSNCSRAVIRPSRQRLAMHAYEIRPRKDHRGVDLISGALPFGRLWYGEPNAITNPVDYAKFFSRSHDAVIRVYDAAGNVIETHEHKGDFIAPIQLPARKSTLSETIPQRPMRAGCWRFLHANDDKVTACGFRNDVRSRHVVFRPTVWLFREFSVRIINMNGHFRPIDFCSQPEPIFIPFKQLLPHHFPFTRSELAWPVILAHVKSSFYIGFCRQNRPCPRVHCGGVHLGENRRRDHKDHDDGRDSPLLHAPDSAAIALCAATTKSRQPRR